MSLTARDETAEAQPTSAVTEADFFDALDEDIDGVRIFVEVGAQGSGASCWVVENIPQVQRLKPLHESNEAPGFKRWFQLRYFSPYFEGSLERLMDEMESLENKVDAAVAQQRVTRRGGRASSTLT